MIPGLGLSYAPTKTINEAVIENSHGAQAAFNSNGSCVYHPDILLRQKTFTGWKILEKECPRCKIEWEDRRRAALLKRGTSTSYIGSRMYDRQPSQRFSLEQQPHAHSQPNLQHQHAPFHPQGQLAPHQQSIYYHQEQHHGHHLPPSQMQFHVQQPPSYHPASQPSRPSFPAVMPPQPLEFHGPGVHYDNQVPNAPQPFVSPPSRPIAPVPFVPHAPIRTSSLPTAQHPSPMTPRPWVSEAHLQHISDDEFEVEEADEVEYEEADEVEYEEADEVEVEEADEEPGEADVELDLITAYTDDDVETILEIMKEYQGSPTIQGVGCKALLKLCNRCDDNAMTVLYCGAKDVVQEAYKFFKNSDPNVAGDGFVLLELFKRLESLGDQSSVIPEEPVPDFTPKPQKSSLADLPPIDPQAESSAKQDLNTAYQKDDIQSIIRIMGKFTGSSPLQGIGCKALWRLSHRYGKIELVLKCGGYAVVEDSVFYFGDTNDDVGGYGQMILDLSNRTTESSDLAGDSGTTLPGVNPRIERIAVDDIKYFGKNNDPQRIGALMSWYRYKTVQGQGCKELWSILQQSESFDELLTPGPTQAIKDAVYYFAGMDDEVDEYGTQLLNVVSPHEPQAIEMLQETSEDTNPSLESLSDTSELVAEPAMKNDEAEAVSKPTLLWVKEQAHLQNPEVDDDPQVSAHPPIDPDEQSHVQPDDVQEVLPEVPISPESNHPPADDSVVATMTSTESKHHTTPQQAEPHFVDEIGEPEIVYDPNIDEPEIVYDPTEHQPSSLTSVDDMKPVNAVSSFNISEEPQVAIDEFPSTGVSKTSPVPPVFRKLVRNTKNMATNIATNLTVSLANGELPSGPPLPRVFKRMTTGRKSTNESSSNESTPQRRHPMSSSFTNTSKEPTRDPVSSSRSSTEPAGDYSRTLTSRNLASIPSVDPELEANALRELSSMASCQDVKGVLEVMRRHPSRAIQEQACSQLWELCIHPNKAAVAVNSGGIDVVEDALFYFGKSIDEDVIFGYGTVLLELFNSVRSDPAPTSQRMPAQSANLSLLDPRVERILSDTLVRFTKLRDVDNVVATMNRYAQYSSLQGLGCIALWEIVSDADAKAIVVDNNGTQKIVQVALERHGEVNENVAEFGSALLNLFQKQKEIPKDVDQPSVLASACPQPEIALPKEAQERVRVPLSSLVQTDPLVERIAANSIKSFDSDGDVESVLAIMKKHPASMAVVGQGVKKLWEFCFCFDKIDEVLGSSAKEIIEDATFYFGKTDSNVAEYAPMIANLFT